MGLRKQQLLNWVCLTLDQLQLAKPDDLSVVSGDASFRRYFRAEVPEGTFIAVDAPPEKEDSHPFVEIANKWHQQGIPVPKVMAVDFDQGFMLLEDFGDHLFAQNLEKEAATRYPMAIDSLIEIQRKGMEGLTLPPYSEALLNTEMSLFTDWLIDNKLDIALSEDEKQMFEALFTLLAQSALEQPKVPVHRDYHSRNLMIRETQSGESSLGVIDFQDAVDGPITYDLVSLLKDCYVRWSKEQVESWLKDYFQKAIQSQLLDENQVSYPAFKRWFDLMGVQRHLKAAGIFARLSIRDGKHGYLQDIANTVQYIRDVSQEYVELNELGVFLENKMPGAMLKGLGH